MTRIFVINKLKKESTWEEKLFKNGEYILGLTAS